MKRKAFNGSAATAASQGLRFIIQLLGTMVLARVLMPEHFGLLAMALPVIGLAFIFSEVGLSAAVIQARNLSQEDVNSLFWINIGIGTILSGLIAALAPVIALFYGTPELTGITLALSANILIAAAGVQHQSLLRRDLRLGAIALQQVVGALFGTLVGIALAMLNFGVWSLVAMHLVTTTTQVTLAWIQCPFVPRRPHLSQASFSLATFGSQIAGSNLLNFLARNSDNVMIGAYWGASVLGLYSKAYSLLLLPVQQLTRPLSAVATPALSRLQDEPGRYRYAYLQMLRLVILFSVPISLMLLFFPADFISVLLGPGWEGAVPVLAWLAPIAAFQTLAQTSGWLFVSQKRGLHQLRWTAVSTVLTLAAFAIGLPFGIEAVAALYSLSGIFIRFPLLIYFVTRVGPIRFVDLRSPALLTASYSLLIAIMLWGVSWLPLPPLMRIFVATTTCVSLAIIVALALAPTRYLLLTELARVSGSMRGRFQ